MSGSAGGAATLTVGYLGPAGTFSHEALRGAPIAGDSELVALPTIHDTVMAVQDGRVDRALVPIENSVEGAVDATLDTLVGEAPGVVIVGELVHPVHHCLVAPRAVEVGVIEEVASHPQASGQCARFLREHLPGARIVPAASTAEAVRCVVEAGDPRAAAIGPRLAADLYGAVVVREAVEDVAGNATRFVWLARQGEAAETAGGDGRWKTSIVFHELGQDGPGWLVRCLSELAFRGVNLSRIESRPLRDGLGRYMFFADLDGARDDPAVAGALEGLGHQAGEVRVLGSYPRAA